MAAASRIAFLRREMRDRQSARERAPARIGRADLAHPGRLRLLLVVGCTLAVGVALWTGDPSGYLRADPALAHLLRGMAVIKAGVAVGAVGAVLWRFGMPISKAVAFSYVAGCSLLAGSAALIWQLTFIPLAAVLFHVAALSVLVVGWRER